MYSYNSSSEKDPRGPGASQTKQWTLGLGRDLVSKNKVT